MVRDLLRRRWRLLRWCDVLLLHELGAVQDNNARHRRKLRREPILPCAIDTAAAPFVGEAAPSPARPNGWSERVARLTTPVLRSPQSAPKARVTALSSKDPPAKPGALMSEPLQAAWG